MLSARAGEERPVEGLEAGADDYLVKPFSARELLARVRANLELDRVRRARDQLDRSQELLDQAQRLARIGSWEVDLATGEMRTSEQFLRMLGLTDEEFPALGATTRSAPRCTPTIARRWSTRSRPRRGRAARSLRCGSCGPTGRAAHPLIGEVVRRRPRRAEGPARLGPGHHRAARRRGGAGRAAAQRRRRREHGIADDLQRSLLPPRTFDPEYLEVATFYRAGVEGTRVGGDWYDVIELPAAAPPWSSATSWAAACAPPRSWASCAPRCAPTHASTSRRPTCWSSSTASSATSAPTRSSPACTRSSTRPTGR